jgi:hypothetical protein
MGYYHAPEDAARAYDRKAVEIHGRLGKCRLLSWVRMA